MHTGQNRITRGKCEAQNVRGATYSSRIYIIIYIYKDI